MKDIDTTYNPWTPEDEQEHFPSVMEWWAVEAFFKTLKDYTNWCLKVAFTEWYENKDRIGSISNITLFNLDTNTHIIYYKRDDVNKLRSDPDKLHISFEKSSISGAFPKYHMHFVDPDKDIIIDFDLIAQAYPHWIAQDITKGWLPLGLGFYRYGFIPKNLLIGTIQLDGKIKPMEGIGYYEHVWGDFLYDNPLGNVKGIKKTLRTYWHLIEWWLSKHTPRIPHSITFSTENNPFGYDWAWAVFDNGWSLFYGNLMFWVMDGPVMGSLMLTKDGKQYEEFSNMKCHYTKTRYAQHYDFYYPTEFEVSAQEGKKQLFLKFSMTKEPREYVNLFPYAQQLWMGLAICEGPGRVVGFYDDGKQRISLTGICKIEPQRQLSLLGHNTLKLEFIKPPSGVGINCTFESHFFKKQGQYKLVFTPWPHCTIKMRPIDPTTIHCNSDQLKTARNH
ncbi:MAG: hypothetical protein KKC68_09090 [Candidatus Thermoplasmatota archaeon]|nr:hypothetical protein [Candidatus Thermoplasmatota archaeon]MBU1941915.1 hypothetical protein [Candidatus Thermoplasmatota archaeon]